MIYLTFNQLVGDYPYQQYSVIKVVMAHGIRHVCSNTGKRSFNSLVGVTIHEVAHSWFQFVLATNESKYSWFDEGFMEYISAMAEFVLRSKTLYTYRPLSRVFYGPKLQRTAPHHPCRCFAGGFLVGLLIPKELFCRTNGIFNRK